MRRNGGAGIGSFHNTLKNKGKTLEFRVPRGTIFHKMYLDSYCAAANCGLKFAPTVLLNHNQSAAAGKVEV